MKNIFKYIGLFFIALLTSVIVYPFFHEAGHSVAAVLVGGKVEEFCLFPLPYVACNVIGVEKSGNIIIGVAGNLFPLLISFMFFSKRFWIWYIGFLLRVIEIISFIFSSVMCILYRCGIIVEKDDAVAVLEMWSNGWLILTLLSLFLAIIVSILIIKERPMKKCMKYFNIK